MSQISNEIVDVASTETPQKTDGPEAKRLSSLAMIWRFARNYPREISYASAALFVAALATASIPASFKALRQASTLRDNEVRPGCLPNAVAPMPPMTMRCCVTR